MKVDGDIVRSLGQYEFFAEQALLRIPPHSATITAMTAVVEVFVLSRDAFALLRDVE